MGIGSVLTSSLSGLHVTERGLEVVSRNVANAGTEGYTRKVLNQEAVLASGDAIGVRARSIDRQLNELLQRDLRQTGSALSNAQVRAEYLDRVDLLFGQPGGASSLDTIYNKFSASLEQLAASPDSTIARQEVVGAAQLMAQKLNQMTTDIQSMRTEADRALSTAVDDINKALKQIEKINAEIIERSARGAPPPDLLDARDAEISRLSQYMDIQVFEGATGTVSVFTESGVLLFDGTASVLSYDERGSIGPDSLYSSDPAERGVGTITVASSLNGFSVDLLQPGVIRSGSIAAYAEIRDKLLVQAQSQIDEIAASLAEAFNSLDVAGTAATVGLQTGFDLDLSQLKAGNSFSLNVTAGVSAPARTFTFVRVDDPASLPLSNDLSADPNDTVVGIDFSGGFAGVVAQLAAALGPGFTVSDQGGNVLRVLDDGAAGLSDVNAASARVSVTSLTSGNVELPFFIDAARQPPDYTGSLDASPQKRGFAGRIAFNSALIADPSRLVVYSTAPQTGAGDPTRPTFFVDRLNAQTLFNSSAGIGTGNAPFGGDIGDYLRRVVDFQTGQSADAQSTLDARKVVQEALQSRFDQESGVNMDTELANLLVLQNAYAANARILEVVNQLYDTILRIV